MKTPFISYLQHLIPDDNDAISFAEFMELALYHPDFGFYNRDDLIIGEGGVYTTAAEISPLYAQCFAKQCLQIFERLGASNILEIGAGSGRFALNILKEFERVNALPDYYYIYDVSLSLREKQQALLNQALPHLRSRIIFLDQLPQELNGIIIANEVLDALPVHCFRIVEHGIKEKCVGINNKEKKLIWKLMDSDNREFMKMVHELHTAYEFMPCYESEVNLHLPAFLRAVAGSLQSGVILFADYGYGQREYYHPERFRGTLSTIYRGARLNDALLYPGEQDITAHVDFTQVAEYAVQFDCTLMGYTTQAAFLLANGLIDFAEEASAGLSMAQTFNLHQAIKSLTLPSEMGETVKIMALGKNIDINLSGFKLKDHRREL